MEIKRLEKQRERYYLSTSSYLCYEEPVETWPSCLFLAFWRTKFVQVLRNFRNADDWEIFLPRYLAALEGNNYKPQLVDCIIRV